MDCFIGAEYEILSHSFRLDAPERLFFLIGLLGWLTVGFLSKDHAIMLILIVALAAMIVGLAGI